MKEKYENLSEFIDDILAAAELASNKIVDDMKENKEKCKDENAKCNMSKPSVKTTDKIKEGCIMHPNGQFADNDQCLKHAPGNITIDSNDHYILNEMCAGWPTLGEYHLIFEHFTDDGYRIPGITEQQLLAVLYNRYKNKPEKLHLVRQLMS